MIEKAQKHGMSVEWAAPRYRDLKAAW